MPLSLLGTVGRMCAIVVVEAKATALRLFSALHNSVYLSVLQYLKYLFLLIVYYASEMKLVALSCQKPKIQ